MAEQEVKAQDIQQDAQKSGAPIDGSTSAQGQADVVGDGLDLSLIDDVPVHISVEVGCKEMPVKEVLALQRGSVVDLERMAGEPLDVLVNGMLVARGEVVMIDGQYGVRLTEVVSPAKRHRRATATS